ncbi:hypothetical protein CWC08_18965, partial [Pseudoalteromonas ruthenica]|uniref:hypothetical protein n=1 Tax=Pseudoalteromonas ruthenica TaxID=151081 RepID=UPI001277AC98
MQGYHAILDGFTDASIYFINVYHLARRGVKHDACRPVYNGLAAINNKAYPCNAIVRVVNTY